MFTPRILCASGFLVLCLLTAVLAQGEQPGNVSQRANQTNSTVTASATAERVRFTAPSNIVRTQLQVISDSGQILFDVSTKGNVLDWSLQDSSGQRLQGSYLIVVTVKSLSGRLSERIGSVSIGEKQVELQRVDATQLTAPQQQAVGPIEENAVLTILKAGEAQATTVLANNGQEGQVIRDRGALSFRLGDFFSGNDQEQMRLTEEGNLGIGTSAPKSKLDVAGEIRARQGFVFNDGSTLNVNDKGVLTHTSADGTNTVTTTTQNRLAKFTDNAGTVGDSVAIDTGTGLQLTAAPSGAVDTNLLYLNSTNGTTGVLAGNVPSYGAANGPFFAMRGNTYTTIANQRGLFTIAAGNITSPAGDDGSVKFNTGNDILRMVIRPSGNVGIGTPTPVDKLDVAGNINTSTQYNIGGNRILSNPGTQNLFAGVGAGQNNTGSLNAFFGKDSGLANTDGGSNSFFGWSSGAANTSGSFNTFSGSYAGLSNTLGVSNAFFGSFAGYHHNTGQKNSFFGGSAGYANVGGDGNTAIGYGAGPGSGNLTNATAIGALAEVDASNSLVLGSINGVNSASANTRVGIGTTAPSAALDVRDGTGASSSGSHVQIGAPNANGDEKIIIFGDSGCLPAFSGPCVYIGEQDVDDRMVLRAGGGGFRFRVGDVLPDSDNSQTLGSSTNRWSAVWAANGTIQTSDVRLKQGVADLKYGLSQVMQLRPVSFQWKEGNDKGTHLGLIAQEVDAVMPEAVQKSADANAPLGLNYSNLIPVLIKAIQEQQGTLDRAQAEIKTLRAENDALNKRIITLEGTSTATRTKKVQ